MGGVDHFNLQFVLCHSAVLAAWRKIHQHGGKFPDFHPDVRFTALCFVEGGLQGHAIAWLVSVPLCALLLLGQKAATRWAIFAFVAASAVAGLDLMGIRLPVTYDMKWNRIVSAAGYLGLIAFMFVLGLDF